MEEVRKRCQSAKLTDIQILDVQGVALAALRATGSRKKTLEAAQRTIDRLRSEQP